MTKCDCYFEQSKMPEIKENDLLVYDGKIRNVFLCTDNMSENIEALFSYRGYLIADYYDCPDCYYNWVEDIDDILKDNSITAIYRKQGKDYICIWEK